MIEGPFTTQEALRASITPGQLRSQRWRSPFRGVHEERSAADTFLARCRALARVLPCDAVFSGVTTARLQGWWLPRGAEVLPFHVTVPPSFGVERRGVRHTRPALSDFEVIEYRGLRVTSGPRTLRDLAADWSLLDLVVLTDSALRFGFCTAAELRSVAELRGGRGVRTLRRAVTLSDKRSESAMETLLRLLIVLPGLPAPTPQATLRDSEGGWLARVDLLAANRRSVLEYNGADHNTAKRRDSDASRWRLLYREGYEVFPYTARDIFLGPVHVVTDYQKALGLPIEPDAVKAWLREWQQSSHAWPPSYTQQAHSLPASSARFALAPRPFGRP